ncbi:MAG TPA: hypothetical protein VIM07_15075 [Chitinophagaceae bacterium]
MPAIPYLKVVKEFAVSHRLPFWTWKQISTATKLYNEHAALNN